MALINCPECNQQISDKASACIHCGCPLDDVKLKKVVVFYLVDNDPPRHTKFADAFRYFDEIIPDKNKNKTITDPYFEKPRKPIIIDNLDVAQANAIYDKLCSLGATCKIYNNDDNNIEMPMIEDTGTPKCPTCHSTKIRKLGIVGKSVSVGLFGLASNKVGKTFSCDSCGYTW